MLRNSIAGLPDYVSDSTPERIAKAAGLAKMTRYKPPLPEPQRLMPP